MDVGGMQARLAAVGARPAGLGPDQPYARTRRVEMHLPLGRVEVADVLLGEELRCGVRPFERTDPPLGSEHRPLADRNGNSNGNRLTGRSRRGAPMQHIPRPQRPPAVPPEPAQRERRGAPQEGGHVQAAVGEEYVRPQPVLRGCAHLQQTARGHRHRFPLRDRRSVDRHRRRSTRDAHGRRMCEPQRRSLQGAFEAGSALVVAERPVAEPEGQVVHRPARRHAHLPVAGPPRPVLDRGQRSAGDDLDPRCRIAHRGEGGRGVRRRPEGRVRQRGPYQAEVRLDTVHPRPGQRLVQPLQRVRPVGAVRDDLREHRVVRRRDFRPRLDPAVHAHTPRELDPRQQARARPVFA